MTVPVLSFNKVTYSFSKEIPPLINELSLDINRGTAVAVIGANGAGKTTLFNIALGWYKPLSGSVILDAKPLESYTRRETGKTIALVPQNEHIPFEYSLLEYVLLGRAPYVPPLSMPGKNDFEIAERTLDSMQLNKDRSITTLSGGEKQLLFIARALTQQPKLLLLDEPASHLDLKNKQLVQNKLKELGSSGITIIMTTHDPSEAAAVSSDIIMMKNGSVITAGSVSEVLTAENLSSVYGVTVKVVEVEGEKIILWR